MTKSIGNYQVIRQLGEGHYGTVYLAIGEVPARGPKPPRRRIVAIKTLREDADEEAMALLTQEFALLEQVKHRGIVRVFEYLYDENAVVMEYIHGVSLQDLLDALNHKNEQIFTEAVIEIGIEVADALYQAFTTPGDNGNPLQLVHRDLKPANIMLTPQGEVKVLDFGLARVDNADFARDNPDRIRGTPIYMAPEQARGEEVGHATDLFALGLILYELLMKQAAYRASMDAPDPVEAVFQAIESGDVHEQCGELERRLPGLGPIVTRLLQSRPLDRFQNGQDLLVALRGQLYRDRGVYLTEFCEFFFGPILAIEPVPKIEDFADLGPAPVTRHSTSSTPPSGRASAAAERKRRSIGERLQASMSMDAKAQKTLGLDQERRADGRTRSNGGQTEDFKPGRSAASDPQQKVAGQRRPDETGMIEMMPVGDAEADLRDIHGDPNSTQMIALKIPKGERAKPAAPPSVRPGGVGGPPPPPSPMGSSGPPRPPGAPPPPPPGGPQPPLVAAGNLGGAAQAAPPSAHKGPFKDTTNAGGTDQAYGTVQSARVYAIVACMFGVVGLAIILGLFWDSGSDADTTNSSNTTTVASTTSSPSRTDQAKDTGGPPAPPVRSSASRSSSRSRAKSKTTTPARTKSAKRSSSSSIGGGNVIVRLPDSAQASGVELVCGGGAYRLRKSFSSGVASFSGVPGGVCTFYFKGGLPSQFTPVTAGRSYSCSVIGSTAVCK